MVRKTQKSSDNRMNAIAEAGVMLQNIPGALAIISLTDMRFWGINDGFRKIFRISPEVDERTISLRDFIEDAEYSIFVNTLLISGKEDPNARQFEAKITTNDGCVQWISFSISYMGTEDDEERFAMINAWNIDKQKMLEDNLHVQVEKFNLIKDLSGEFVTEYDVAKNVFSIPEELILRRDIATNEDGTVSKDDVLSMVHQEDVERFTKGICDNKSEGTIVEFRLNFNKIEKSAKYHWYRAFSKNILDEEGNVIRIISRCVQIPDGTERNNDRKDTEIFDSMTGVLSRESTDKEITEFFNSTPSGKHAFILIDVDNFKEINENFGRLYGDSVLKNIAKKIKDRFRNTDIVGRVGGDEFAILMRDTTSELAESVLAEIREAIRTEVRTERSELLISCSMSICMYPDSGIEYNELYTKAERALYRAKMEGRDKISIYKENYEDADLIEIEDNKKNSEFVAPLQTDAEFMTMCVEMLVDATNLDAAINLLLENVGMRYHLGGVAVFRFDRDRTKVVRTNKWTKESGIFLLPKRAFTGFDNKLFIEAFDEHQRIVINDMVNTDRISEIERDTLIKDGVSACVYSSFHHSDSVQGCVAFQNMGRPRNWSEGEKNFFAEFARIISVFLALLDKERVDMMSLDDLKAKDQLTGLWNEETFIRLVEAYRMVHPEEDKLFIVSGDIDGFSYVNENFGNSAGSELLKEVARIYHSDQENIIVCRQFSDFFAGFFAGYTYEEVANVMAIKDREFVEKARQYYPNGALRPALGIYKWEDDISVVSALENAAMARKHAKKIGSHAMLSYNDDLRKTRERDRFVSSHFYQELDEGNIIMYLQPKFDLRTREIIGAESLARWKRGTNSLMSPGAFMDSLERLSYVTDLDFFIFEQTLKNMMNWKDRGLDVLPISINFSRKHFNGDGIYKRVKHLTDYYKIPHHLIEIELTESILSEQADRVIEEMRMLREDGFLVDIDDFGSGFSSLGMLLDMDVDVVKIDKSFLDGVEDEDNKKYRAFMSAMAELVNVTSAKAICEGIETEEQVSFLVDCGFQYGQGYVFDKPIPIIDFEKKYIREDN